MSSGGGGVRLVGARAVCIVWVCCAVCVLWVCLRQASCGHVRSVCRVGVGMRVYKEMSIHLPSVFRGLTVEP